MMTRLSQTRVIIFGLGGVGSWCAEALARTGIGYFTLVDSDCVDITNINRQMPALHSTVGQAKVEVVSRRIIDINPSAEITVIQGRYTQETAADFGIENYSFAIDAIDSLADKADLILRCTNPETAPKEGFFSSMGAARKMDIGKIDVAEFWKVEGCPLARALRTRFRKTDKYPRRKFKCVYSPETLPHRMPTDGPNGTFAHATAAFGLRLAQLVVNAVYTS